MSVSSFTLVIVLTISVMEACAAFSSLIAVIVLNAFFFVAFLISVLCVCQRLLALCLYKIESEKRETQQKIRAPQCKTESSYSFIHFQFSLLSDLRVTGALLEPLVGRRQVAGSLQGHIETNINFHNTHFFK